MTDKKHHDESPDWASGIGGGVSTHRPISRRAALRTGMLGGVGLVAVGLSSARPSKAQPKEYPPIKGRLKQSVNRGTLGKLPLDEICQTVKRLGLPAIDGIRPNAWATLKAYDVDCSLCLGAKTSIAKGVGSAQYHDELVDHFLKDIDLVADAGYRNLMCFSGNRNGMAPEEGLANAVAGLKRVLGHAEKRGVTIMMELLNSKRNHPDYLFDNTEWGVALCKQLGSPNFGLLYDIYHAQIMEGDIIATIRKHHQYLVHYHTAGVPDRHEIGANQELNYLAICRAIVETGFDGYLAHEFVPAGPDPINSLREAIHICDV